MRVSLFLRSHLKITWRKTFHPGALQYVNLHYVSYLIFWMIPLYGPSKKNRKAEVLEYWDSRRTSRLKMFFMIGVLKNFAIFTEKHLCWSHFLINFIKKRLKCRCFPVNIGKFLRTALLIKHFRSCFWS